jgi:restriction endonuclease S subunit
MTSIKIMKLKEVAEITMGQSPPSNTYSEKNGMPFFQGKAEFGIRFPTVKKYCTKPIRITEKNSILMSVRAPVGSINISNQKACIGRGLCSIKAKPGMDYLFLFHYLKMQEENIASQGQGSTFKAINKKAVENIEVSVPSLKEQKKIVSILEKVKEIQEKNLKSREVLRLSLVSYFNNLLNRLLISTQTKIEMLGEICDVRDGTHESPKYVGAGFPLITSKNITNGTIDFTNVNLISKKDLDKINKRSLVDEGDIIMPMIGTIGNPVIVIKNQEFGIKNVALIKFQKSTISNIYIQQLLSSNYFNEVTKKSNRGGTQKFIALKDIRNIPIPIPNEKEQKIFSEFYKACQKMFSSQEKLKNELNNLLLSLMQKYFGVV